MHRITPLLIAWLLMLPSAHAAAPTKASQPLKEALLQGTWPSEDPMISLSGDRIDVSEALRAIAKKAGWSLIMAAPESALNEVLTLDIRDLPARKVLGIVLRSGGLRATWDDGVVRVEADSSAKEDAGDSSPRVRVNGGKLDRALHSRDRTAIGGSVRGDAVAIGGRVEVHPGAQLRGDQVSLAGSLGGLLSGTIKAALRHKFDGSELRYKPWKSLSGIPWTFVRVLALFVLAFLLLTFMPRRMDNIRTFLDRKPGHSLLGGLALVLGFIPACVLLAVTLVGIPLIPLVVLTLLVFLLVGLAAFVLGLGYRLPLLTGRKNPVAALALGIAAVFLVNLIPWVGPTLVLLAAVVASGAVILSRFGNLSNGAPRETPAAQDTEGSC